MSRIYEQTVIGIPETPDYSVMVPFINPKWMLKWNHYLAWALEQRCDLITTDEKFLGAARPAFACLRLLKHFESHW